MIVKWNYGNIGRDVLKGDKVRADLEQRAGRIASAATSNAGGGAVFGSDSRIGSSRAKASVFTDNFEAIQAEADSSALTKAINAGRN
jgi:hypothetical protein